MADIRVVVNESNFSYDDPAPTNGSRSRDNGVLVGKILVRIRLANGRNGAFVFLRVNEKAQNVANVYPST